MTDFQFKAMMKMCRDKVADAVEMRKSPEDILKAMDNWLRDMGIEPGESKDKE